MRIGLGVDFHPFAKDRPLYLGGIKIDYPEGLAGHSDADVLTHAICDAILGAAGLEDIGKHFPDDDRRFKDISSLKLLEEVIRMVEAKGYRIINIDAVIIADRPRLGPYYQAMRHKISAVSGIPIEAISIKAKRTEGLGLIGEGKGIAAIANALIEEK
ncbi:2-C-methyl-D-erythritol 2,4-cyclodiphosphate synthase [candidate division WOR-3 bacterium]|uniref:2-C-methyl-D-erythritol 2,4-cyclodiphosphate synthase n=1 Tax=candidate division WOR-3 bacterium TaxID=2052148 RepID=A0A660SDX2_UNCW3|nr:MAG: 2-C-methyl-D-erythritol 2,4-cyclodiphosphate synthase [candidate division WOR-3 bacterium]